jgi:hypothetical protein
MPTFRRVLRPQPGPQETFLSSPADIAVYGGGAFGGKTWALVYEPLRHRENPQFAGVIFRREAVQVTNPGGLWDESLGQYAPAGGVPTVGDHRWTFPGGSRVSFHHLKDEKDKLNWQGAQVPYLGFDELTHFTASQFWYLLSRNRSLCGVRPYVRATTNPEPGWVRELLSQWVAKDHPDPARSGELRWFVRVKGDLVWARTREELAGRFPDRLPKSLTFVKALIWDNRIGMALNPEYLGNLQALPPVEQARLLGGDWDVKPEGLCYPGLLDCVVEPFDPPPGTDSGGIDFGFSNPFAAEIGTLDHDDCLWVHAERYVSGVTLPTHAEALPRSVSRYWCDPSRPESIAELNNGGFNASPCVHLGKHPKHEGIDKVNERIRTGRLKVSRRCINLIREAGGYVFDKDGDPVDVDNHACDALRYLVVGLDRGRLVKPPPPRVPTAAELDELARLEAEEKARRREEHRDLNNPYWWGDND